ncbi:MAG: GNAT family N-acetyltransferase [Clostridium sp.]|nr:GNAT family N-acetyltransferase [Clostridium sp.]
MGSKKEVKIEPIKGALNDYVIKDKDKIVMGRFTICELDKENKRSTIRFKFYRENNYELLKVSIDIILRTIFKDGNINKVNFLLSEISDISAFLDLGFTLESILSENLMVNGVIVDELGLGITRNEYISSVKNNIVYIKGSKIIVRNFTPADAEELTDYYIRNTEHLRAFEPTRDKNFYEVDMQRRTLIESYKQLMVGTGMDLGIYLNGKLIGKIKVSNIVQGIFKSAIIGYSIDKEHEGKGYMKEAVLLVEKYCKQYLDLHRLEASVLVDNNKSKRVLLKSGFEELGVNKKYLYINGKWRDHITFYKILE